jgi:hypothetical protein
MPPGKRPSPPSTTFRGFEAALILRRSSGGGEGLGTPAWADAAVAVAAGEPLMHQILNLDESVIARFCKKHPEG